MYGEITEAYTHLRKIESNAYLRKRTFQFKCQIQDGNFTLVIVQFKIYIHMREPC